MFFFLFFFLQQILTLPCKTQPDHVFPILYCSILVGPCKMLEAVWTFSSDIWLTDELFLLKEMTLTGNCLFFSRPFSLKLTDGCVGKAQ